MQHGSTKTIVTALGVFCFAVAAVWSAVAGARDTAVIVNGTRTVMMTLQMRDSRAGDWQGDLLMSRPLGIQKQIAVPLRDGCVFDLRASFEDGHRLTKMHVNLCRNRTYLLSDI